MYTTILSKLMTQSLGDSFLWKGLAMIFIAFSSAFAYYLKIMHDIELGQSEMKQMVSQEIDSLKQLIDQKDVQLKNSLLQIAQNQETIYQQQQQMEVNEINRNFYINLSYVAAFFCVVGGVILLQHFVPHVLEYIWPTNNSTMNLMEHANMLSKKTGDQLVGNHNILRELISEKIGTILNQQFTHTNLINQILANQSTSNQYPVSALRATTAVVFDNDTIY
jgi:hypothetical protein